MEDCRSKGMDRMKVFERQKVILQWQRIYEFQLHTLKHIATALLAASLDDPGSPSDRDSGRSPGARSSKGPPSLYIPGEITRQPLIFERRVVAYASPYNPGAKEMAIELRQKYGAAGLKFELAPRDERFAVYTMTRNELQNQGSRDRAGRLSSVRRRTAAARRSSEDETTPDRHHSVRERLGSAPGVAAIAVAAAAKAAAQKLKRSIGAGDNTVTHMLLYLNDQTYLHEMGQRLAHEVRIAMSHNIPIVMVHENDVDRGGCQFGRFFQTTPEDLIRDGLYKKLALAAYADPLREVSLALIAKGFGAVATTAWWRRLSTFKLSTKTMFGSSARDTSSRRSEEQEPQLSVHSPPSSISASDREISEAAGPSEITVGIEERGGLRSSLSIGVEEGGHINVQDDFRGSMVAAPPPPPAMTPPELSREPSPAPTRPSSSREVEIVPHTVR